MKVIFFGTPDFAAGTLAYMVSQGVEVVAVVTKPDKPKGRSGDPIPCAVKRFVLEKLSHIPLFQPEKASDPDFYPQLRSFNADVFVVVAYGEIISQPLLDMPKIGCINVHASLLPKYRGAAPIQRCIMEGEKEAGVTIMHMVKKMDAGDMIKQASVLISPNMTSGELHDSLLSVGSKCLVDVLKEFEQGIIHRVPQDESLVTYAKKIELEDCEVQWHRPAQELHNLVRGVTPFPGAWCYVQIRGRKMRLKLLKTSFVEGYTATPGSLLQYNSDGIIVSCGTDALRILDLQLEGKRPLSSSDFVRGNNEVSFI